MKRQIRSLLLVIFFTAMHGATGLAADGYVDIDVAASGDGKTWATAWKNFADINWGEIAPGDTVWISGGIYSESITLRKGGIEGSPIKIKASQQSGHNDLVDIRGGFNIGADWITIDGAKNDFAHLGWTQGVRDVYKLSGPESNINIRIYRSNAINVWGNVAFGITVKWCDLSSPDEAEAYGFRVNPASDNPLRGGINNFELAYCWIHDVGQDGVTLTTNSHQIWDAIVVHHCLIERVGDDGLEVNGGITVHHSIIQDTRHARGHPDGIQTTGDYVRLSNNVWKDWSSSYILTQGSGETYDHLQIYGNLIYVEDQQSSASMVELKWYPLENPYTLRTDSTWTDWVFANNTIINVDPTGTSVGQGLLGVFKRDYLLNNAHLRNMRFQNNIILNDVPRAYIGGIPFGPDRAGTGSWEWSPPDVVFSHNVITGHGPHGFGYYGTSWPTAEDMNAGTIYDHNSSARPDFVNFAGYDFQLQNTDGVAKNKGVDLTSLSLPGFNKDLFGNDRGHGGAWDIGAFEEMSPVIKPIDRFVDIDVPTSGDGKSWATAWKNFSNINWDDVSPGATIWVSGGRYDMDYFRITKSGEPGNPIRIKASQEPGHNDYITLDGSISVGANWVEIDGAKNDYFGSSQIGDNTLLVPRIKDNINMTINAASRVDPAPVLTTWATNAQGLSFRWLKLEAKYEKDCHGVLVNSDPVGTIEVAYNWMANIGHDGVYMPGNRDATWDNLVVHHCLIEGQGDDGIESAGGLTAHHNIIRDAGGDIGHADGIQNPGSYNRVYSNIFHGVPSQLLYFNLQKSNEGHVHVYGNLVYACDHVPYQNAAELTIGVDAGYMDHDGSPAARTVDWIYVNNTIVHNKIPPGVPMSFYNRFSASGVTVYPDGIIIKNNILYNGSDHGFGGSGEPGWSYDQTQVLFDHNLVYSEVKDSLRDGNRIIYDGVTYENSIAFNAATSFKGNVSERPAFKDETTYDFSLASNDTGATNRGEDLSSLGLPGLNKDLTGNYRGQQGAWDIGAFEYGSSGYFPPGTTPTPHPESPLVKTQFLKFKNILNPHRDPPLPILIDLQTTPLTLSIYDRKGKLVRALYEGDHRLGLVNDITWDGRNDKGEIVASGVYFIQLNVSGETYSKKVVVVK